MYARLFCSAVVLLSASACMGPGRDPLVPEKALLANLSFQEGAKPKSKVKPIAGDAANAKDLEEQVSDLDAKLDQLIEQSEGESKPWWGTGVGWATSVDADRGGNEFSSVMFHFKGFPSRVGEHARAFDGTEKIPAFTWDRFFLSAGVSLGKVGGSDLIDGPLYALGAGYDITPEFGFMIGVGYFEEIETGGDKDVETSLTYGVVLELPLFQKFFQ